jgi:hypothetical protein
MERRKSLRDEIDVEEIILPEELKRELEEERRRKIVINELRNKDNRFANERLNRIREQLEKKRLEGSENDS